eukprot:SAG11_NODE_4282_length_1969_cov_1.565775_4_plen_47_part_01
MLQTNLEPEHELDPSAEAAAAAAAEEAAAAAAATEVAIAELDAEIEK